MKQRIQLGDLVKTFTTGNTHIPAYAFSLVFDQTTPDVKMIVVDQNRRMIEINKTGIILRELGKFSNRWFMVYFADEASSYWISPVHLQL